MIHDPVLPSPQIIITAEKLSLVHMGAGGNQNTWTLASNLHQANLHHVIL